ncbi:bacteriocin fulvocin C-related protein [Nocardia sp. CDC159]|uniref:Bacteriocin fulvocin C-related protein n=1 Tax=Nocardia pulmonis TaxID=2951408 RepID=A0A9X2IYP6_9NOCA|nr:MULTISPECIES: bacteriocin fulvocin C-related protein [Nocardia]MCM6776603.1 bacteriocin fulvocin C-related protein [Nocardia pulmonis]MCM6789248.1 bacteriocin fulvocin C-related protein [Nocardia sp. CDC159]
MSMRVIGALGRLRYPDIDPPQATAARATINRKSFLRYGAGAAVAAGLLATGNIPAFAASGQSPVRQWVEANRNRLPQTYDEFVAHSMPYRRAIFSALEPRVKSQLWVTHLARSRDARADLTTQQREVINRAVAILGSETTYAPADPTAVKTELAALKEAAVAAYGRQDAGALLATLGPADVAASPGPDCACADQDPYCDDPHICKYKLHDCNFVGGCGTGWVYVCNGLCE